MSIKSKYWQLVLGSLICMYALNSAAFERNINLDSDWKFHLGDVPRAKDPQYDDHDWRTINVPHDFSIEGDYSEDATAGWRGGYLPTGIGWYRKTLKIDKSWLGKKVILRFDGVYLNSDVWINGKHVGHRPNGYVSFEYDITPQLFKHGKPILNTDIAVRVDHSLAPTGRWYTGSGIYRHVWLDIVDEVHIPNDGVFVRTEDVNFTSKQAKILVDTKIEGLQSSKNITLIQKLTDANGEIVSEVSEKIVRGNEPPLSTVFNNTLTVENAQLWSTKKPYLYLLETQLWQGNTQLDNKKTRVGIRTIAYNVDDGFLLNNQPVILKGMSFHHDAGPVGSAVPDDVWRHRLQQLKDMGMNALRPAHTPFAPVFYDIADEMGFLIMNEAFDGWEEEKADYDYGLYFEKWWQQDLTDIVTRDRNHPSVVIWSVGNEVNGVTVETQKKLVDLIKSLDDTRPVTQGRGYMLKQDDIAGFNGHGEYKGFLEQYHKENPKRTMIGTEITHTLQTRGVYRTKTTYRTKDNPAPWEKHDPIGRWNKMKDRVFMVPDLTDEEVFTNQPKVYDSSYDNSIVRMSIRDEIKLSRRLPYLLGTFRWTAFDYLGESFGWPARTANFGVIDLAGFKKDGYYLYQSQWSDKPMVHMLPHWTHPGKEGVKIPVVVYTNLEQAELFLNGKSLGIKKMTDDMQIVWQVPYEAGELKVVARSGNTLRSQTYNTAEQPAGIGLSADKKALEANDYDVARIEIEVVDKNYNFVPDADNQLSLNLTGPGKIIGVENGDILDLSHHVALHKNVFKGKLMVLVQSTKEPGNIVVSVSGDGLKTNSISMVSH